MNSTTDHVSHATVINEYLITLEQAAARLSRAGATYSEDAQAQYALDAKAAAANFAAGCKQFGDSNAQIAKLRQAADQLFGVGLRVV